MERIYCSKCGEHGGKFVFRGDKYTHESCLSGARTRDTSKSVFPFTTMNIGGGVDSPPQEITVQSLHHLRQLEAQHGVQSYPFNYDHPESRERFER